MHEEERKKQINNVLRLIQLDNSGCSEISKALVSLLRMNRKNRLSGFVYIGFDEQDMIFYGLAGTAKSFPDKALAASSQLSYLLNKFLDDNERLQ